MLIISGNKEFIVKCYFFFLASSLFLAKRFFLFASSFLFCSSFSSFLFSASFFNIFCLFESSLSSSSSKSNLIFKTERYISFCMQDLNREMQLTSLVHACFAHSYVRAPHLSFWQPFFSLRKRMLEEEIRLCVDNKRIVLGSFPVPLAWLILVWQLLPFPLRLIL